MAARTFLRGLSQEYHGHIPLAANDLDRICDRTEGEPHQSVHVHRTETRVPADVRVDIASTLAALLTAGPEVLAQALANMEPADRARVVALLPVDAEGVEPVDAEAKVLPAGDDEPSGVPTQDCD